MVFQFPPKVCRGRPTGARANVGEAPLRISPNLVYPNLHSTSPINFAFPSRKLLVARPKESPPELVVKVLKQLFIWPEHRKEVNRLGGWNRLGQTHSSGLYKIAPYPDEEFRPFVHKRLEVHLFSFLTESGRPSSAQERSS
jgi:hypothetical protein